MKNYRLISLVFVVLLVFSSCSDNPNIPNTDNAQTNEPIGIPSISELHTITQSSFDDPFGYYASVLAFLEGDTEELALRGSDDPEAADYSHIGTIEFSSYEITESETGSSLEFSFVVSNGGDSMFEPGEYHYNVWETWTPTEPKISSEQYGDLVQLIDWMTGNGCISWENGKSTSLYHDAYTFDFGVNRAVGRARGIYAEKGGELPEFDFDDAVYKMFCVKDFSSTSEYLAFENGKWTETQYIGDINVMHTILDIRENGDYMEVDVQYYADMFRMIPSIKTTIYVRKTDDPIYKFCFEKSIIVESSEYDPMWWAL
ncbi:MAG: hypothetical protein J6C03_00290 [Clostridia bacterium]|nr:hypothetical protein [Clostridia bacterium]